MHELIEPALAIVHRLAGVVFHVRVVVVEQAADAGLAGAIEVQQLAILTHAASSPDMQFGLRIELARRQLDRHREDVGFGIRIHAGPWRLAGEMRLGEIPLAPDVEQILDAVEIEEESVPATASEECVVARLDEVWLGAERDLRIGDDSSSRRLRPSATPRLWPETR